MSKAPTRVRDDLQPRYAGQYSRNFWKYVNGLRGKDGDAAYDMACMLQDLESRVLRFVNEKLKAKR